MAILRVSVDFVSIVWISRVLLFFRLVGTVMVEYVACGVSVHSGALAQDYCAFALCG